jgi:hypothetical protein
MQEGILGVLHACNKRLGRGCQGYSMHAVERRLGRGSHEGGESTGRRKHAERSAAERSVVEPNALQTSPKGALSGKACREVNREAEARGAERSGAERGGAQHLARPLPRGQIPPRGADLSQRGSVVEPNTRPELSQGGSMVEPNTLPDLSQGGRPLPGGQPNPLPDLLGGEPTQRCPPPPQLRAIASSQEYYYSDVSGFVTARCLVSACTLGGPLWSWAVPRSHVRTW